MNRAPTAGGPGSAAPKLVAPGVPHDVAPRVAPVAAAPALGAVVRAFKAVTARAIRQAVAPEFAWQRNYYEQIIRDEEALDRIVRYILDNPARWSLDPEHPRADRTANLGTERVD